MELQKKNTKKHYICNEELAEEIRKHQEKFNNYVKDKGGLHTFDEDSLELTGIHLISGKLSMMLHKFAKNLCNTHNVIHKQYKDDLVQVAMVCMMRTCVS